MVITHWSAINIIFYFIHWTFFNTYKRDQKDPYCSQSLRCYNHAPSPPLKQLAPGSLQQKSLKLQEIKSWHSRPSSMCGFNSSLVDIPHRKNIRKNMAKTQCFYKYCMTCLFITWNTLPPSIFRPCCIRPILCYHTFIIMQCV